MDHVAVRAVRTPVRVPHARRSRCCISTVKRHPFTGLQRRLLVGDRVDHTRTIRQVAMLIRGGRNPRSNSGAMVVAMLHWTSTRFLTGIVSDAPGLDGQAESYSVHSPRGRGGVLSCTRRYRGETHIHDGSVPASVILDTHHVIAISRLRESRLSRVDCSEMRMYTSDQNETVFSHLVIFAPGPVASNTTFYVRPHRQLD